MSRRGTSSTRMSTRIQDGKVDANSTRSDTDSDMTGEREADGEGKAKSSFSMFGKNSGDKAGVGKNRNDVLAASTDSSTDMQHVTHRPSTRSTTGIGNEKKNECVRKITKEVRADQGSKDKKTGNDKCGNKEGGLKGSNDKKVRLDSDESNVQRTRGILRSIDRAKKLETVMPQLRDGQMPFDTASLQALVLELQLKYNYATERVAVLDVEKSSLSKGLTDALLRNHEFEAKCVAQEKLLTEKAGKCEEFQMQHKKVMNDFIEQKEHLDETKAAFDELNERYKKVSDERERFNQLLNSAQKECESYRSESESHLQTIDELKKELEALKQTTGTGAIEKTDRKVASTNDFAKITDLKYELKKARGETASARTYMQAETDAKNHAQKMLNAKEIELQEVKEKMMELKEECNCGAGVDDFYRNQLSPSKDD